MLFRDRNWNIYSYQVKHCYLRPLRNSGCKLFLVIGFSDFEDGGISVLQTLDAVARLRHTSSPRRRTNGSGSRRRRLDFSLRTNFQKLFVDDRTGRGTGNKTINMLIEFSSVNKFLVLTVRTREIVFNKSNNNSENQVRVKLYKRLRYQRMNFIYIFLLRKSS